MRSRLLVVFLTAGAIGVASGCARTHARTAPMSPPLDVPAPPPRDVERNDSEPPEPMPLPQEPAHIVPPRARTAPPPRPEPSRPVETPRAEPATPEPPRVEEPPRPAEEAPKPPPTLQTIPANAEGEVERGVRAAISKANNDLNRINYQALNEDARTQYDTARSFIRQAESAIRQKNLVIAKNLADKAAALAAQLGGK